MTVLGTGGRCFHPFFSLSRYHVLSPSSSLLKYSNRLAIVTAMPSAPPAHPPATSPFNETTADMVFTPFVVMVLAVLSLLVLVILGTLGYAFLRSRRASQVDFQTSNVDVEAQPVKDAYFEVVDHGVKSASLWSRLSGWVPRSPSHETEPELPWPVYSILPHLRPKAPLHVRLLKAVTFWRKEEVKVSYRFVASTVPLLKILNLHQREPFTVADVQRAKAELEARIHAAAAACVVRTEEHVVSGWRSHVQIPEIVIHPCDDTPLMYGDMAYTSDETVSKPVDDVSKLSLTSALPEADKPLHPIVDEAAVAVLPLVAADDALEVPMPSLTTCDEGEEVQVEELGVGTLSDVSGKAHIINTPSQPEALIDAATSASERASSLEAFVEVDHDPKLKSSGTKAESSTSLNPGESATFSDALSSSAPGMEVDPSYSPASTASEPDSPMPLTPIEEAHVFPLVFIPTPLDVFDSGTPPSIIAVHSQGKRSDVRYSPFEEEQYGKSEFTGPDSPLRVGLGLSFEEVRRREEEEPQFVIGELSPANSGDSIYDGSRDEALWCLREPLSASSSGSVPEIRRVLDEIASQSSTLSHEPASKAFTNVVSSPSPMRTPFAGILGVLQHHNPSSEIDVFIFNDEDNVDKDNSANASVAFWRRRLS